MPAWIFMLASPLNKDPESISQSVTCVLPARRQLSSMSWLARIQLPVRFVNMLEAGGIDEEKSREERQIKEKYALAHRTKLSKQPTITFSQAKAETRMTASILEQDPNAPKQQLNQTQISILHLIFNIILYIKAINENNHLIFHRLRVVLFCGLEKRLSYPENSYVVFCHNK